MSKDSLRITGEDLAVIQETLRTGDLNIFTSRYMCLPNSGTMWMPGNDSVGHYRATFRYDLLYDAWKRLGRPEDQLVVTARAYQYNLRVVWDGMDPTFLLPHGYMFLDWVKPVIDPVTNLALVITGTGAGKCLPGRSIVSCADGTRKRVDELRVGDKLVGVDGSYRMAEQTVVSRWSNGLKPLLRVVTSNGTTIDCTPNHPLLKATGWVEAGKIAVGDRVGLPRSLPSSHKEATVTLDEAKVVGYLLGDGGLTDASARFTNVDERVQTEFKSCIESMGHSVVQANRPDRAFTWRVNGAKSGKHSRFLNWLRALGMMGCGAHDKFIPETMFAQPDEIASALLSRMFACDGWASVASGNGIGEIAYCTVSRQLADDLRTMLLRFGILSRLRERNTKCQGKTFRAFEVKISGQAHLHRFSSKIGIFSKECAVNRVVGIAGRIKPESTGSDDVISNADVRGHIVARAKDRGTPTWKHESDGFRIRHKNLTRWKVGRYGDWLDDQFLKDLSASDVYWDRVVSIESIPAEETFDIEVTPDHNFVADGFYTHNTSSIAVAALTYCVLYPGFHFMNLAPTGDQATLMMEEAEKWITNTPFEKFIRRTRTGELFKMKPQPKITISSPLGPKHQSWFVCQTVGLTGDSMLGKHEDWTNIDEVQLVDHIEEVVPKVITRSRGQRSSGSMRWSKLTMLTNPGPNPALLEIRKLIEKLQADPETRVKAIFMKDIDGRVNVNISDRQQETMAALMDASDRDRWLSGLADSSLSRGEIPTKLIERCESDEMTEALKDGKYAAIKRDGMGIIHYEIAPEDFHEYIVVGDPGMGNPVKKSLNNIPIVLVFDITDFLTRPARLVYFSMIDGMNDYKPWLSAFRNCMLRYSAKGYYDATNLQQAFESAGAFDGGIVEDGKGGFIKVGRPFDTTPVTFAVNNKRWARGTFVMLMQDSQFEWPHLDTLWHQAAIYKETGEGHLKLADDILAAMFVYALALRIEGALWEKMAKHYHWDAEEETSNEEEDAAGMYIARPRNNKRIARNRRQRGRR